MASLPVPHLTAEEYLRVERQALEKSEFFAGQMYAMAGDTGRHGIIAVKTASALDRALAPRGCIVFNSDVKVLVDATGLSTYPDVSALCGRPQYLDAAEDVLVNPMPIVEVLSPSTESYDRGAKFQTTDASPRFKSTC